MNRFSLWLLLPWLLLSCARPDGTLLSDSSVSPAAPSENELSDASTPLQPLIERPYPSLVYPQSSDLPPDQRPAPAVVYSAEVDLTSAAAPEQWVLKTPPLPYAGDVQLTRNQRVDRHIAYYTGNGRKTFSLWLERAGRYLPMMQKIFVEEGIPRDLAYLALVESGFNSKAASWAHAVGPWQFIESTGRYFGMANDWWLDERRDPEKSTRAAARYLKDLLRQFDGDVLLAVASYNAGPGKIRRAMDMYKSRDYWRLCEGKYLQEETKDYVPKLMAVLHIVRDLADYGLTDLELQPPLSFDWVEVDSTTDLEVAAELCGVTYDDIKTLNPELKRWSTPTRTGVYRLRVPLGTGDAFTEGYAQLSPEQLVKYLHHRVAAGDTLSGLAKRYGVRSQDILALNSIRNPKALKVGSDLILPLSENFSRQPLAELTDDYVRTRRQTYKVRSGDSLWSIANRFDVTERQLRVWNRLGWSNILRPGQNLVVAASAAAKTTTAPAPAKAAKAAKGGAAAPAKAKTGPPAQTQASAKAKAPQQRIEYRVQAGDTLWAIGRQFQVPTAAIRLWNKLAENHVLRPGDRLTLYLTGGSRS